MKQNDKMINPIKVLGGEGGLSSKVLKTISLFQNIPTKTQILILNSIFLPHPNYLSFSLSLSFSLAKMCLSHNPV